MAGGSLGGLCAGVALRGIGCEVDIYERTPGVMASRGAGIVVQPDLTGLLRRHEAPELPTTSCRRRRYLRFDETTDGRAEPAPQRFTSWGAIHGTLRAVFPAERYHPGSTLTGFGEADGRVAARFDGPADEVVADLLVCADGSRSDSRRRLLPEVAPRYAGYIAWRGTLEEAEVPPDLARFMDGSFTFCDARSSGHALCYFIPGPEAATEPGRRRLNWVWYVHVPDGPGLERLLTDRDGRLHAGPLPAGTVPDALVAEVKAAAEAELHPRFAEMVAATPEPFVQIILDVVVPRMAFGRACLVGDAAFVVRPHTAAATAKAASDATALADALAARPGDVEGALGAWQASQLEHGRGLAAHGVALAANWTRAR